VVKEGVLAWLVSDRHSRSDYPAVTLHHLGQGQAVCRVFDLGRSIAYTQQGNQERDLI
jgi:hypothetical protein